MNPVKRMKVVAGATVVMVLLTVLVLAPPPALAAQCPGEENFFVERPQSGVNNYGSWNHVFVNDRAIDSCTGPGSYYGRTGGTAIVTNTNYTKHFEIGWEALRTCCGGKLFQVFIEGCLLISPYTCYVPKQFVAGSALASRTYSRPTTRLSGPLPTTDASTSKPTGTASTKVEEMSTSR